MKTVFLALAFVVVITSCYNVDVSVQGAPNLTGAAAQPTLFPYDTIVQLNGVADMRQRKVKFPSGINRFTYSYSNNLSVSRSADTINVKFLDTGLGYVLLRNANDTLLWVRTHATAHEPTEKIKALLAKGDTLAITNKAHADWVMHELKVNKRLPSFKLSAIGNDAYITNDNLKGKITLLNFWYYGCGACEAQWEELRILKTLLKDTSQYQWITVNKDSAYHKNGHDYFLNERYKASWKDRKLKKVSTYDTIAKTYTIAAHKGAHAELVFNFRGYPYTVLIDKQGIVRLAISGYFPGMGKKLKENMQLLSHLQ